MLRRLILILIPIPILAVITLAWYWYRTPQPGWFGYQPGACAAVAALRANDAGLALNMQPPAEIVVDDSIHPPRVYVTYDGAQIVGIDDPAASCDLTIRQAAERVVTSPPFIVLTVYGVGATIYGGWWIMRRARRRA